MTTPRTLRSRRIATGWFACMLASTLFAAAPKMRLYTIDLPNHVLRFSLPEEIAQQIQPFQIEAQFVPTDSTYVKDGFRSIVRKYYQFQGPFWVGAYGALRFEFTVVRREKEIPGKVTTSDELESYIPRWIEKYHEVGYGYGRAELSGAPWVLRQKNTFGRVAEGAEEMQGFSCPIDETMFFDVGFWITETVPGSAAKWKPQAEAFREAIKATIVLQPKSPAATNASRL